MKLAEALAMRADATRRVERLRTRISDNARFQEGAAPAEDAGALLTEADHALADLETLIRQINRTNAATPLSGGTMTDALARRDVLRLRHKVLTSAADAAAGREQMGFVRQLRSELVYISALPVSEVRRDADEVAKQLRELDVQIQRTNWEADLLE